MKFRRIVATGLALALGLMLSTGLAVAEAKPAPTAKVNINTASADQFETLPGVGAKLAARIVEYRQKAGARFPFLHPPADGSQALRSHVSATPSDDR